MIIDPDRDGCTIWEGTRVQHIKGNVEECCQRIMKYVSRLNENTGRLEQAYFNIGLDVTTMGIAFADWFNRNNIEFSEIKAKRIL